MRAWRACVRSVDAQAVWLEVPLPCVDQVVDPSRSGGLYPGTRIAMIERRRARPEVDYDLLRLGEALGRGLHRLGVSALKRIRPQSAPSGSRDGLEGGKLPRLLEGILEVRVCE